MECLMDHIVLNLEDGEKMIAFYSKVLMFAPERLEEYNAGDVPFPLLVFGLRIFYPKKGME